MRSRRFLRTLPLIAAAIALAGMAVAGVSTYVEWAQRREAPRLRPLKLQRTPHVMVGGRLLGRGPASSASVEPAPAPTAAPPPPAVVVGSTPPPSLKQYSTELALLEPARRSLGRGDYGTALTAIAEHRRAFPNGQLSEEREALKVRALWGLGQRPAALAAAKVFSKRYPRSGLLSWLKVQSEQAP